MSDGLFTIPVCVNDLVIGWTRGDSFIDGAAQHKEAATPLKWLRLRDNKVVEISQEEKAVIVAAEEQAVIEAAEQAEAQAIEHASAIAAAKLASFTAFIPHAAIYKATLRSIYPEVIEPEKDQSITYMVVANKLLAITLSAEVTIEQKMAALQASIILKELFTELSVWNGTGETFTLPWELVP